ncbi:MAG: hypothetical protein AMJ88_15710 [Anaerolineae bacterium SM23_ 63]|nr:MAG: hypothetical protein AMJ88_15710 [Anaerolineae bacterium SM23_ 63]
MPKVTLETVANIQVGYQAKAGIKEKTHGKYRLIQGKNFDSFQQLRTENLIKFDPERNPKIYSVHKGDVLFQSRGVTHYAYCIEEDLQNTLASGSFYIIHLKSHTLLPQYLAWWLNQTPAQAYFLSQTSGTIMGFVSKHTLSHLLIQIPSLSVQKKIVKIVSLVKREQFLLSNLSDNRSRLINAVCIKATQKKER